MPAFRGAAAVTTGHQLTAALSVPNQAQAVNDEIVIWCVAGIAGVFWSCPGFDAEPPVYGASTSSQFLHRRADGTEGDSFLVIRQLPAVPISDGDQGGGTSSSVISSASYHHGQIDARERASLVDGPARPGLTIPPIVPGQSVGQWASVIYASGDTSGFDPFPPGPGGFSDFSTSVGAGPVTTMGTAGSAALVWIGAAVGTPVLSITPPGGFTTRFTEALTAGSAEPNVGVLLAEADWPSPGTTPGIAGSVPSPAPVMSVLFALAASSSPADSDALSGGDGEGSVSQLGPYPASELAPAGVDSEAPVTVLDADTAALADDGTAFQFSFAVISDSDASRTPLFTDAEAAAFADSESVSLLAPDIFAGAEDGTVLVSGADTGGA